MTTYIWVLSILMGLTALGKLYWLVTLELPKRKPGEEAIDIILNCALIVWGAILLNN